MVRSESENARFAYGANKMECPKCGEKMEDVNYATKSVKQCMGCGFEKSMASVIESVHLLDGNELTDNVKHLLARGMECTDISRHLMVDEKQVDEIIRQIRNAVATQDSIKG